MKADLGEWFPATETVLRPLHMKRFDGAPLGFAYALKPDFARRISPEPRTLEDGNRSTFSTRKPIWGAERVELALALDRAGLAARLFLRGSELVASRDSRSSARRMRESDPAPASNAAATNGRGREDALNQSSSTSRRKEVRGPRHDAVTTLAAPNQQGR